MKKEGDEKIFKHKLNMLEPGTVQNSSLFYMGVIRDRFCHSADLTGYRSLSG